MPDEQLIVQIRADIADLKRGLGQVKTGLKDTERNVKSAQERFAQMGLAVAKAVAVFATIKKAKDTVLDLANAAGIQEQAEYTLAEAMKVAGTYTKEAHQHNLDYASSLQKVTTFGDETILMVQKMLTNFGVEGEMMDELTKATLDLAAAKGMDLKAAADLVAKSVGSSTNALSRYGIVVEGTSGSTERMQMAVENITELFGGAAQAKAQTYLGRMEQLTNQAGDFKEEIGERLIPTIEDWISGTSRLIEISDRLLGILPETTEKTQDLTTVSNQLKRVQEEIAEREEKIAEKTSKLSTITGIFTGDLASNRKEANELRTEVEELKKAEISLQEALKEVDETTKNATENIEQTIQAEEDLGDAMDEKTEKVKEQKEEFELLGTDIDYMDGVVQQLLRQESELAGQMDRVKTKTAEVKGETAITASEVLNLTNSFINMFQSLKSGEFTLSRFLGSLSGILAVIPGLGGLGLGAGILGGISGLFGFKEGALAIPKLQEGAHVTGPTMAMVGEGPYSEWVLNEPQFQTALQKAMEVAIGSIRVVTHDPSTWIENLQPAVQSRIYRRGLEETEDQAAEL